MKSVFKKIQGVDYEIIVVDNKSVDETRASIKKEFPEVVLLLNNKNMGVAKARNQGMSIAKGRYILILDADAEIISEDFNDLIRYMDKNTDIGILGCSLISDNNELHPSTRTFPRPIHIILRRLSYIGLVKDSSILKKHHLAYWDRKAPMKVDFVEGAFQLIRKEAIDKVGLLDGRMFYGFEDADYCARMIKADYYVVCYPSFVVKHYLQGITRKNPFNMMALRHYLSYMRFYLKHRQLILGKQHFYK